MELGKAYTGAVVGGAYGLVAANLNQLYQGRKGEKISEKRVIAGGIPIASASEGFDYLMGNEVDPEFVLSFMLSYTATYKAVDRFAEGYRDWKNSGWEELEKELEEETKEELPEFD